MHVIICGAGIIGSTTAYFLARRGAAVTVIERSAVACAASGKAGGFLALDWSAGTALDALSRRSFHLHAQLAHDLPGDWGYRRLNTFYGHVPGARGLNWTSGVALAGQIGTHETTAQVHPALFTRTMMDAAQALGATLRIATVTGLTADGITTDQGAMAADAVVIAMGPWSGAIAGIPPVFADKGHSLVFATGTDIPDEALFLELRDGRDALTPEFFPRPDGTTYVSAISRRVRVPDDPADVQPEPGAWARLEALSARLSPALRPERIVARQACCRPSTADGLPLIGPIPGRAGAFVATGHSVWGILNAPATAEALTELILDGAPHAVDLATFATRPCWRLSHPQLR